MEIPNNFHDPYLILTQNIVPRPGFTLIDEARNQSHGIFARAYEKIRDARQQSFRRDTATFLRQGAACGLSPENIAVHFWAQQNLKFLGFLIGQTETEAVIQTRGSVIILVPGATEADRGRVVFCRGPNDFSLSKTTGAAEIGQIRYVQNGRAAVAFRRYDDKKTLDLRL